jgi:hypothetical protein
MIEKCALTALAVLATLALTAPDAVAQSAAMELSTLTSLPEGLSIEPRWARREVVVVRHRIDGCFDEAHARNSKLLGILDVRLFLSKSGSPGIIQVNGAEDTVAEVKDCIMERLKKVKVQALAKRYDLVTFAFLPPGESGVEVMEGSPAGSGRKPLRVVVGLPVAKPSITVSDELRAGWARRLGRCADIGADGDKMAADLVIKVGAEGYVDDSKVVAKKLGKETQQCLATEAASFRLEARKRPYKVVIPLELNPTP